MIGSKLQRARTRGFTLLIAIVLASVATAIGIALASLAYKNVRISQVGQASQVAFYTADTTLECALYADQKQDTFDYFTHPNPTMVCANGSGTVTVAFDSVTPVAGTLQFTSHSPSGYADGWFPLSGYCARVTIYKTPGAAPAATTYLFAEGLSNCNTSDPRTLERGIYSYY